MNYIAHLTGFFHRVSRDYRLNPTHVSLYMALFQQWNLGRFRNPLSVSRTEVMQISRISSRVTYHKCIRELHAWGYLHYDPSYNYFRGSLVYIVGFDERQDRECTPDPAILCTGAVPVMDPSCTGAGPVLSPSVNSINNTNLPNPVNGRERARGRFRKRTGENPEGAQKRKRLRGKRKERWGRAASPGGGARLFPGAGGPGVGGLSLLPPLQRQRLDAGQEPDAGLAGGGAQVDAQRVKSKQES